MTATIQKLGSDPRAQLATIARHEGVWDGIYRHYDADGLQVDEHRSRLFCRFPQNEPHKYHQTNHYTWPDGHTEVRDFPALIRDGRLIWQGNLIRGWAADVSLDDFGRTTMLYWTRNNEPGVYVYEMIQISDCGKYRSRTWQWFKDGRLVRRTLIDEHKVSDDWSHFVGQ
ncbi:MAG: DUF3598 domain-containing protein [Gammaproteobacteria bacterium PRO9]|nr:DUF3598 domain-containing protein [Gammaproteobacteria bacterium PRO9]